jgi:hypothetical protein
MLTIDSEQFTLAQVAERFRGDEVADTFRCRLSKRLRLGWTLEDALTREKRDAT